MFTQTTIPLVPTVTIPLSQFNLMKRALRAAWIFREHQFYESKNDNDREELQKDLDAWRDLEHELDS